MTIPLVQVSKRAAGAQGTMHGSQVEGFTRPAEGDNCPKLKAKEQEQSRWGHRSSRDPKLEWSAQGRQVGSGGWSGKQKWGHITRVLEP